MKEQFIAAYQYAYGATKKQAIEAYKTASISDIIATITSYKQDIKKAFYED